MMYGVVSHGMCIDFPLSGATAHRGPRPTISRAHSGYGYSPPRGEVCSVLTDFLSKMASTNCTQISHDYRPVLGKKILPDRESNQQHRVLNQDLRQSLSERKELRV